MSNFGTKIYNGVKVEPPISIKEKFLSITTFDGSTDTDDIDKCIFNLQGTTDALVFSPVGHIYLTSIDASGNLLNNSPRVLKNPIVTFDPDYYHDNFTNWKPVDYKYFFNFNSDIQYPQFFVSLDGDLGKGVIGSGYILYRDSAYPITGTYHLLYNPFNRASKVSDLPINLTPVRFSNYCNSIQFQDSACYCNDDSYHRCVYAAANSDKIGNQLINIGKGISDPSFLNSLNGFKANCGCNSVCKRWEGRRNIISSNLATCAQSTSNVFCTAGLSAATQGEIQSTGINITQNCGMNPSPSPKQTQMQTEVIEAHSNKIIIGAAIIGVILIIILGYFFLKK